MPVHALDVLSVVVGGASSEPAVCAVRLELATERLTVREIIERAVAEQVRRMSIDRRHTAEEVLRALDRQYLTEAEVSAQAKTGRVRFPSRPIDQTPIDVAAQTAKALRAFKDRHFFVVVDEEPLNDLNAEVVLTRTSSVTFLRLMPLAGGAHA